MLERRGTHLVFTDPSTARNRAAARPGAAWLRTRAAPDPCGDTLILLHTPHEGVEREWLSAFSAVLAATHRLQGALT